MTEIGPGDSRDGSVPSDDIGTYARSRLRQDFHIPAADLDDILGEAQLDLLQAPAGTVANPDGLFLLIARRRAIDYLRSRKSERLPRGIPAFQQPDTDRLDIELAERWAGRLLGRSNRLSDRRMRGIVHELLAGRPFAEACQLNSVPRGSQSRYREALKKCLRPWRRALPH